MFFFKQKSCFKFQYFSVTHSRQFRKRNTWLFATNFGWTAMVVDMVICCVRSVVVGRPQSFGANRGHRISFTKRRTRGTHVIKLSGRPATYSWPIWYAKHPGGGISYTIAVRKTRDWPFARNPMASIPRTTMMIMLMMMWSMMTIVICPWASPSRGVFFLFFLYCDLVRFIFKSTHKQINRTNRKNLIEAT